MGFCGFVFVVLLFFLSIKIEETQICVVTGILKLFCHGIVGSDEFLNDLVPIKGHQPFCVYIPEAPFLRQL